jgi:broad specificity phosphatase PhoE
VNKHQDEVVVVVSHGGTINRIIEYFGFKKHTDEYIRFQNTSVTVITKNDRAYKLEILNDISHL